MIDAIKQIEINISDEKAPFFHWDVIQGSDEWHALRAGKMTASVFKTFLVDGKQEGGFGAGAITEMYKIIEERITGIPRESFKSKATDWGHEYEDEARQHYELINFTKVHDCGFIEKDDWTGASPDGLIPHLKKGVEIKCRPTEHMRIVDTDQYIENDYLQCQCNLWVSGYESWDLVYYHPNLPDNLKMKTFTFTPDKEKFKDFEKANKFKELVKEKIEALQA